MKLKKKENKARKCGKKKKDTLAKGILYKKF